MKVGIHAYAWCSQRSHETLGLIDRLKHLGLNFIEIALMCLVALSSVQAEEGYFKDAYKSADRYRPGGQHYGYPIEQNVPPWPSQYKLRPTDRAMLTPADVVGPDGIVYPNWNHVGVEGGIPEVEGVLDLADLGAKPETDISELLQRATEQVGTSGGGAIVIGEGTFYLDKPVTIRHSKIVIRGAGRDATKLIFRFSIANAEAKFPGGWPEPAVFTFQGGALEEEERLLVADGKRGDTFLTLQDVGDLKVGDAFVLRAPVTRRWQAITRDTSRGEWGTRSNAYRIRAITGNRIEIGEALRIDFPVVDGSTIRRMVPVAYSGLEDFTLTHTCRMPFHSVTSQWAWNCWVQRLSVLNSGKGGAHFNSAKRCEVRDSEFTGFDATVHKPHRNWWGYAGFTQSWDCLMENTIWRRFRHGPQVQYGAQGNVIRNSTFEGSDAQWHAGWATENLFENCVVTDGPYGSYGHGAYSTGSNDSTHGPNGPRNVVYNCSFSSRKDGFYNRGVNENWLILYNHFVIANGSGYRTEGGSFDAIIRGNTFVLSRADWPMVMLTTRDCTGTELIDNILYGGNGELYVGEPELAVNRGNRALPLPASLPERPQPAVPSLYEYLRKQP